MKRFNDEKKDIRGSSLKMKPQQQTNPEEGNF